MSATVSPMPVRQGVVRDHLNEEVARLQSENQFLRRALVAENDSGRRLDELRAYSESLRMSLLPFVRRKGIADKIRQIADDTLVL